jgi:aminopeptidase N
MGARLCVLALLLGACASTPRPRPQSRPVVATPTSRHRTSTGDLYQLIRTGPLAPGDGRTLSLGIGEIVWTRDGKRLTRKQLATRLRQYDVILVGEVHASRAHQAWQARIIEALAAAKDRPLAVGLEMLPRQTQSILDKRASFADERSFLLHTGWYRHWGYDYRYYRPIFRATAAHKLPLVALNGPRKLNRAVARFGLTKLPPRLRALLPPMTVSSADHRRVFVKMLRRGAHKRGDGKASKKHGKRKPTKPHPSHGAGKRKPPGHPATPHGAAHHRAGQNAAPWLDRYFAAQVLWDATMADSALRYLRRAPRARLVLLAGAGHAIYGVGIRRQLLARSPKLKVLTVMPIRVPPIKQKTRYEFQPMRLVSAAVADIAIGVASPSPYDRYPTLGVKLEQKDGALRVVGLPGKETPARRAGVRVGDVLRALDGAAIKTVFDVRWALVDKRRGSTVTLRLLRAGKEQTLSLTLK